MKKTNRAAFALASLALGATATMRVAGALPILGPSTYEPYIFTTLAGLAQRDPDGIPFYGSADGTGSTARFYSPQGVAVDSAGNVYVADTGNQTIRKVTQAGLVTTLAGLPGNRGGPDGVRSEARFASPSGLAVDSAGNIYVTDIDYDSSSGTIRKMTPEGVVTTLAGLAGKTGSADGTGSGARFTYPRGVAVDGAGNVYVADQGNSTIRKVTPAGVVRTLAGGSSDSADGTKSAAGFSQPYGVAVDNAGNIYVSDGGDSTIRKVTPSGEVTTLAGGLWGHADGTGIDAGFYESGGVAVDSAGNVYVPDGFSTVRKVTPAGVVTTLAGLAVWPVGGSADGTGSDARFASPSAVAVDNAGNIYVADTGNNTIRKGYQALRILNSRPDFGFSGGHYGFNLTGPAGRSVVVETSTDLVNWLPVWTNVFTFPDTLQFSSPQSGVSSHRFYRAFSP